MTGMETLRLCRAALRASMEQQTEVRMLRAMVPGSPEERAQIARQLADAEAALAAQKRLYAMRAQDAAKVLLGVEGREKQVLWMYYVLGFTIKRISEHLKLNYRDVLKCKAKAIQTVEEEEKHEPGNDHREPDARP